MQATATRGGGFRAFFDRLFARSPAADPPSLAPAALPSPMGVRPVPRGGAGDLIWSGLLQDQDRNQELRGSKWYGEPTRIGVAQQMMRDAHVRQSLDAIISPLLAAIWDFKPASKDPLDLEIADFCRFAFFDALDFSKTLRHALLYLRDGFSLLECTDDYRPIPSGRFPRHPTADSGYGVLYTGFHHRPAPTLYRWDQSDIDPTKLDGIEQRIIGSDGEDSRLAFIPSDRLLRFTQDQEGANFAGLSQLRSAFGPWKTKLMLMVLDAIRHERQGCGMPSISLPDGQDVDEASIEKAETLLAHIGSNEKGYILMPSGWVFEWKTTDGQGTNINEAIERCNRDIAFNVGAGFMLLGLSGDNGSYALAQTQNGQYEMSLEKHARFIASVFNFGSDGWSPVERIIRMNYGPDVACPRLVARNMPTRDWIKALPVVYNLVQAGVIKPDDALEEHAREVMYLPPRDPTTVRELPQKAIPATPGDPQGKPQPNTPNPPNAPSDALKEAA